MMFRSLTRYRVLAVAVALAAAALVASCGGGSPTGPSAGVVVDGTVLGVSGAGPLHAAAGASAAADPVTVVCQEDPSITASVSTDGRFTLRGLPTGGFTLQFKQGTLLLGTASFREVQANQEITVTVLITGSGVQVVEEQRNGIGHGDVEVEGPVQQVVCGVAPAAACPTATESRFLIAGKTIVYRPGQTAIREGNTARTTADVRVGVQVHVKGTWMPAEGQTQPVLASEIKIQDGSADDDGAFTCAANAKAEVEGVIASKGAADITVNQTGKGVYLVDVPAGTPIRKGNKTYAFADLKAGWRVHVSGQSLGFTATSGGNACRVRASEVKVQQD